ncbi:NAD(P)-dependent dehydrogenase (short-subunit alcohol dehydrogenase family) [Antricoccus suffuscus]|uniref:NAD(P)-dependent dehydrogenase (Short-subunit alcohol dehydrogenase family) n=1 Tax=Antricoccus suffuscus TaxID=1629062 RepID=A0A2T1A1I7_9ACTN|nr:SDR family NAD(P)-dependent oxidoreductase [Antricoccus suffuscus]PRZ42456.1 NAD(P)-dependent dehydrogenase (short-subunit alcohol dehydrogenase family) [Antricoccus suffuscus]
MSRFIVTGGASGIGRATVTAMLKRGDSVGVIDFNQDSLIAIAAEFPDESRDGRLATAQADVSLEPAMQEAIDFFAAQFDGLDGIVNNAGIGGAFGHLADLQVEDWDATFAVNTRGVFIGIKHTARILVEQGTGGSIVNVASVAGLIGDAGSQAYSASKAAVIQMGRVFASELAPHKIAVNTVNPGLIATPLNPISKRRNEEAFTAAQPWPEVGRPEHIAQAILFFTSPDTSFITGEAIAVDGGLTSIGAQPGDALGTNSRGFGVYGMNFGNTGRSAVVRGKTTE